MLLLKVCGMKYHENIEELVKVHPDFIGFIFHESSPRNITKTLKTKIPNSIKKTGVFVNKNLDFIQKKINDFGLNIIQLHGNESPDFCHQIQQLNIEVIKAFNIQENFDFDLLKKYESCCNYFLFDAFGKNAGGNGITFNWQLLSNYHGTIPFLLSGGINATMTSEIIQINHPQFLGVDINSGFEIKPGLKDIKKIKQFKNELYS